VPCLGCHEPRRQTEGVAPITPSTFPHPILDYAELWLQAASVGEILPQDREQVQRVIRVIQALKNPFVMPLEMKLGHLVQLTESIGERIPCHKCATVWHQVIDRQIKVRLLLEQGKRRDAVWLWIRSEFWGKLWGLYALPNLLRSRAKP
jgi:hypothetical protein